MTIDITAAHSTNDKRRETNEDRAEDKGLESCICCGKGVTEKGFWIMCADGGTTEVASPELPESTPGYMGTHPIGPTCARKLRKLGVPKEWFVKYEM